MNFFSRENKLITLTTTFTAGQQMADHPKEDFSGLCRAPADSNHRYHCCYLSVSPWNLLRPFRTACDLRCGCVMFTLTVPICSMSTASQTTMIITWNLCQLLLQQECKRVSWLMDHFLDFTIPAHLCTMSNVEILHHHSPRRYRRKETQSDANLKTFLRTCCPAYTGGSATFVRYAGSVWRSTITVMQLATLDLWSEVLSAVAV